MLEVKEAINIRYSKEASCCSNLSCGGAYDLANVQKNEVFVDLGSGKGRDVLKAAGAVGKNGKAIGIDFTKEMLALAEQTKEKLGVTNVSFLESSIESIPLDDSSVDVVISNCTINHAKDKTKVYSEIYRILNPTGRVIVSDIIAEKELPEEIKNNPEAWAGCYGGAIPREEYFESIAKAGFSELEILEESAPYEKGGVNVISLTIRAYKTKPLDLVFMNAESEANSCCSSGGCC